jgi:hypothetical protein
MCLWVEQQHNPPPPPFEHCGERLSAWHYTGRGSKNQAPKLFYPAVGTRSKSEPVGGMDVPAGCQASLCGYYYSYWKNAADLCVGPYTRLTEFVGNSPKRNFTGELNFLAWFPQEDSCLQGFRLKFVSISHLHHVPPIVVFLIWSS